MNLLILLYYACMDNKLAICEESLIPSKKNSKGGLKQQCETKVEAQFLLLQEELKNIDDKLTSLFNLINKFIEKDQQNTLEKTNENAQDKK